MENKRKQLSYCFASTALSVIIRTGTIDYSTFFGANRQVILPRIFKKHTDYGTGSSNRRTHSLVVYLNDGFEGGHTQFHHESVNYKFKGGVGDAKE